MNFIGPEKLLTPSTVRFTLFFFNIQGLPHLWFSLEFLPYVILFSIPFSLQQKDHMSNKRIHSYRGNLYLICVEAIHVFKVKRLNVIVTD